MSSRSNTKRRDSTNPEFLKSGTFYGLKFFDEVSDNIDLDRPINFTPDITLLDSNAKAIFDYSDCTDENTLSYLNTILEGSTLSDTITVQNASHLDSFHQEESDLSGTYVITGIYDKIITTTVSSLNSGQSYDKKYARDSFVDDIKIKINASNISTDSYNIIRNYFNASDDQSFLGIGLQPNDKLRFYTGSNTNILFTVTGIDSSNETYETIELTGSSNITQEDRFNLASTFNIYRLDTDVAYANNELTAIPRSGMFTFNILLNESTGYYKISSYYKPSLVLRLGATYIFNVIGNGTDFSLSATPDGAWNGGSDYPNIIKHKNVLLFTPEKPDTIYYYDKNRRNAGGKITIENTYATYSVSQSSPSDTLRNMYINDGAILNYTVRDLTS